MALQTFSRHVYSLSLLSPFSFSPLESLNQVSHFFPSSPEQHTAGGTKSDSFAPSLVCGDAMWQFAGGNHSLGLTLSDRPHG